MQKTWVRSLGWEDALEGEMATHSSILAQKIPWTKEPGRGYSPGGRRELDTTVHTLAVWLEAVNKQRSGDEKRVSASR